MPHNLTEVDAFTATVPVPDGTDDHATLAEYIAGTAQPLANRTKNLNLHAAKKDAANVFTVAPQKVNQTDASMAALVVDATADQDTNPANLWKAFVSANVGNNGGYNNTYAGVKTGPGQWVHAINAVWDVANQWWVADNTAIDSFAIIYDVATGVFISRRPAGSGHWTTWPSTSGNLLAGGNAQINGALQVGTDVTLLNGEVLYSPVVARVKVINLQKSINLVQSGDEYSVASGSAAKIAVELPHGSAITSVDCITNQFAAAAGVVSLIKRTGNYASPGLPTLLTLAGPAAPAATSGYKSFSVTGGLLPASVTSLASYYLIWTPGDPADTIVDVRVNFNDPGPRNF